MYHVLVAEDELWIRSALIEMVEQIGGGFKVVGEARTGEEAWNQIHESWPNVLLTDIMMPQKDGLWLIRKIAELNMPIVPIIVSGYDNFQYAQRAIRYDVSEYLLKPVSEDDLRSALHRSVKKLERFSEMHAHLLGIQHLLDRLSGPANAELSKQFADLLSAILALKADNPGASAGLLRILSGKLTVLLEADGAEEPLPFPDGKPVEEVRAYFRRLWEQCMRHRGVFSGSGVKQMMIKACEHIQSRYMDDITLPQMAALTHLSTSYFSALFKQHTGQSLINFVNTVRMDKAKELLLDPDRKIYEVAETVGFTTLPYFNRVFKNGVGLSPNEYRKSLGL